MEHAYIRKTASKANSTLGFLKRNLNINSQAVKEKAYMAMVRPTLEYASSVWNPYTQNLIHHLEMVQRRAARFTLNRNRNTSSVGEMLCHLGWPTLELRRQNASLVMFYKCVHGLVAVPVSEHLVLATRVTRHSHNMAYQIPHSGADYRKYSFYPSTARLWNGLPGEIVSVDTVDSFKARLSALHA